MLVTLFLCLERSFVNAFALRSVEVLAFVLTEGDAFLLLFAHTLAIGVSVS